MSQTTDKLGALSSIFTALGLFAALFQNYTLRKENDQLKHQLNALGPPTSGPGAQRVNTRGSYG
jgi:hypothetical protein